MDEWMTGFLDRWMDSCSLFRNTLSNNKCEFKIEFALKPSNASKRVIAIQIYVC